MVLNIESCSEGRKDGRVEEVVEEEEEEKKGRRSSSQNWMGSRASGGRGERERERESCIVALGTLNLLTKLD